MDCVFNNIREQGAKLTGQISLWFISPQKTRRIQDALECCTNFRHTHTYTGK